LSEQIPDALTKTDVLANAGRGQNQWQKGAGAQTLARAASLTAEIPNERARQYAIQGSQGTDAAQIPRPIDPLMAEERDALSYKARSWLSEDWFIDLDAHIDSFASSNPNDRISKLTSIATSFSQQVQEMRKLTADSEKKRKVLQ
jgi:hypothetical protein